MHQIILLQAMQHLKQGETVYLTVADSAGNMVSLIQSNFSAFGSGMSAGWLGFRFAKSRQTFHT